MTKLKIKRDDLIDALTFRFELTEGAWYLDRETGDVLLKTEDLDDLPEDIEENPRYLEINAISSHEEFRIMEDFVATVEDIAAADRLGRALEGRKPFRRFKDALPDYPDLRERWFRFEEDAHAVLAAEWCEANDIEPEWV
ncbi:MAG: hypothetical protein HYU77_00175 [Betaproteobacteria bacterium]|nr:hypothetical protein [Betaproteobacteria bacterium]